MLYAKTTIDGETIVRPVPYGTGGDRTPQDVLRDVVQDARAHLIGELVEEVEMEFPYFVNLDGHNLVKTYGPSRGPVLVEFFEGFEVEGESGRLLLTEAELVSFCRFVDPERGLFEYASLVPEGRAQALFEQGMQTVEALCQAA